MVIAINSHVHLLVTEGGFEEFLGDNNGKWMDSYFIPLSPPKTLHHSVNYIFFYGV